MGTFVSRGLTDIGTQWLINDEEYMVIAAVFVNDWNAPGFMEMKELLQMC